MSLDPNRNDNLEALVRGYLHREERGVDPKPILARVLSSRSMRAHRRTRSFGSRPIRTAARWAVGASAALLVIGSVWTLRQSSAHADAIKLVREAKDLLAKTPLDRLYRVGIHPEPVFARRSPKLVGLATFDCRLWTRSDRFWIEGKRSDQTWACGRDARRHVWLTPNAEVGLDFAPNELSDQFDEGLDLFGLDMDTVLHLMATEFAVTPIGPSDVEGSDVTVIQGTPRPEHPCPRLRSVTVEIDNQTKIVRRMVFARVREGQPIGEVSLTYDQTGNQPDSAYQLAGHLAPGASTLGPDRRLRRRRELLRFLGSLITKGESDASPR